MGLLFQLRTDEKFTNFPRMFCRPMGDASDSWDWSDPPFRPFFLSGIRDSVTKSNCRFWHPLLKPDEKVR